MSSTAHFSKEVLGWNVGEVVGDVLGLAVVGASVGVDDGTCVGATDGEVLGVTLSPHLAKVPNFCSCTIRSKSAATVSHSSIDAESTLLLIRSHDGKKKLQIAFAPTTRVASASAGIVQLLPSLLSCWNT